MSLDGFVAGPEQSLEDPIGRGGMRLHEWAFGPGPDGADARIADALDGVGAYVHGPEDVRRRLRAVGPGLEGLVGRGPPYHAPVFVLTHHPRAPLPMRGGTTFTFVTDGIDAALARARAAAGDLDVAIAGGAATVQQYLAAGRLDELHLHIVPIVLGAGEPLLDGVGDPVLEPVEVVASPAATHVRYRVVR
jgi:dihydrofolate reductase